MKEGTGDPESRRHEYSEACNYHRHYSALRFVVFTVYFAVVGGIATVAFGIVASNEHNLDMILWARAGGVLVTMVFFFIEFLCERNMSYFGRAVVKLEEGLGYTQMTARPKFRALRAKNATYLLYFGFLVFWIFALVKHF
jgi:hypothetical protein